MLLLILNIVLCASFCVTRLSVVFQLVYKGSKQFYEDGKLRTLSPKAKKVKIGPKDMSYVVKGLKPKMRYTFNMTAVFRNGERGYTNYITAETLIDGQSLGLEFQLNLTTNVHCFFFSFFNVIVSHSIVGFVLRVCVCFEIHVFGKAILFLSLRFSEAACGVCKETIMNKTCRVCLC